MSKLARQLCPASFIRAEHGRSLSEKLSDDRLAGNLMIRKAFLMTLKPGHQDDYERRHSSVWPEMQDALKSHGVHNYSIFLERGTGRLFAYLEIESEQLWQQVAETEACRRWWSYMKELIVTNADDSPVAESLDEVFHLN